MDWAWHLLVTALALWGDWAGTDPHPLALQFGFLRPEAAGIGGGEEDPSVVATVFSMQGLVVAAQGPTSG